MAPIVLNTYGTRNQKKRKTREQIYRALKEIGNSQQCTSMFDDGSFVRSAKKIKGEKTDLMVKGVGMTSKRRAKRKPLKDFSQKLLKSDSLKQTISEGQSGSHLTISLDTSCDTTFDRLLKAGPLQKLQPTAQCTSCPSSSDISEQVESSNNCSLFPAPCVTRQNASSKNSSGSLCSDAGNLADIRVTSTPKGVRENKPQSPILSPILSVMYKKSEVNEAEAQDITSSLPSNVIKLSSTFKPAQEITSVHSIETKVSSSSTSINPADTHNDGYSIPLFASFKTMPTNFKVPSTFEPERISVQTESSKIIDFINLATPCTSHSDTTEDSALSKDVQTEVEHGQISLPTEKNDSLEIISIFKDLKTSFESHVSLTKDSTVFSKDIQVIERTSEHLVATCLDNKDAVINCESEDLRYKLKSVSTDSKGFDTQDLDMHSFAMVNRLTESNVQMLRGSKVPETFDVSIDMFADDSDSVTSVRNDVCSQKNSGRIPSFCSSVSAFSNDSNIIKHKDVLTLEANRGEQRSPGHHTFLDIYCSEQTLQTGKCVSNGVNLSCDSILDCDINEGIIPTSYKCQEESSQICVQDSTDVSELFESKHEHTSKTANIAENEVSEVKGKLDGSKQETSLPSALDTTKTTSPNLATDVSYQGTELETDRLVQPLDTEVSPVKVRADTPSPGRPSCRRLSHLVVPQNNEVGTRLSSTSFGKVYSNHAGRMSPCVEDDEEIDSLPTPVSIPMKARQAVLHRCRQTEPILFSEAFPDEFWDSCRKIGEGVYGEVFLSEAEDGGVFKVIPIEGDKIINEEPQKKYEEILSEIVIAMELSELRNDTKNNTSSFSEVKKCLCVKGQYPKRLIELWEEYDADKGSENDCPVIFEDNQLYIILALANGGQDLEAFSFSSADQALSVLKQTAYALAVAESALEFEHRDLHWGNVLIGPTSIKSVSFTINGEVFDVATKGVKATIIDFTLSRMTYDGCCIFNDLARDPTLFTSEGDYQFEVYRLMRDSVTDDWQIFEPFTNLLWLHYLLHKMITMVNYRRRNTKIHQKGISEMNTLSDNILSFTSCSHFVLSSVMK